jgi:hypothetical protein
MEPYLHSHAGLRCAVLNCGINSPLPEVYRPDITLALQYVCSSYVVLTELIIFPHIS